MYKFLVTMESDGSNHKLNMTYVCEGKRPSVEEVQDMINICEGYVITNLILIGRTDKFECIILRRTEYRDRIYNAILKITECENNKCQNCFYFRRNCPKDRECSGRNINYVFDRPITVIDGLST